MLGLIEKVRLKAFVVLAFVASILLIVGNAMPNWSHGYVSLGQATQIGWGIGAANWSPWTLCYTPTTGPQECIKFDNNMHLGFRPTTPLNVTSGGEWPQVQATRAFTVMSAIFGLFAVILAAASFFKTWSLKQELYITTLAFVAAFCGFLSMCIWAGYANTDLIEYGSSFTLIVISWILFFIAGLVGNWERFDGIPEVGKRFISVGVSFLIFVGTIITAALPNWLHQRVFLSFPPNIQFVYSGTFGLFQACFSIRTKTQFIKTCSAWQSQITVPFQVSQAGNLVVNIPSGQLTEVRAAQAFVILGILFAFAAFVAVAVGFWTRDDSGKISRHRIPLTAITAFWSFLATILWADLYRKDSSQDVEYGGAFALNILVWLMSLAWILGAYTKGSQAQAASSTGTAGFTYVVPTGETDADKF